MQYLLTEEEKQKLASCKKCEAVQLRLEEAFISLCIDINKALKRAGIDVDRTDLARDIGIARENANRVLFDERQS